MTRAAFSFRRLSQVAHDAALAGLLVGVTGITQCAQLLKNLFHYRKVRYKGLFKNTVQLHMLFGLVNLVLAKKKLLALHAQGAS